VRIIIFRHGYALDKKIAKKTGVSDFDRPLTKLGITETDHMTRCLRKIGEKPDLILSSPALRAISTAKIFHKQFAKAAVKIVDELDVDVDYKKALRILIRKYSRQKCVIVFGHEPQLGRLASGLLGEKNKSIFDLEKSGVIAIDMDFKNKKPRAAKIVYVLSPKHLP
jgi:phosphohistidine phosphatase